MEFRIIVTGSQTSAIKAEHLLQNNGIAAQVVRAPKYTEGCRFGVEITLAYLPRALAILSEARINYSEIARAKH